MSHFQPHKSTRSQGCIIVLPCGACSFLNTKPHGTNPWSILGHDEYMLPFPAYLPGEHTVEKFTHTCECTHVQCKSHWRAIRDWHKATKTEPPQNQQMKYALQIQYS